MLETLFFYAFAAMTLLGRCSLSPCATPSTAPSPSLPPWPAVAGLFLLQRAEFLFAVQIVLYIGGIMVLFLS